MSRSRFASARSASVFFGSFTGRHSVRNAESFHSGTRNTSFKKGFPGSDRKVRGQYRLMSHGMGSKRPRDTSKKKRRLWSRTWVEPESRLRAYQFVSIEIS